MTDIDLDKLEAPTDAQIDHAIRQTEYKYFGDYEFNEEQHLAVETLVRAASALSAARASAREAAAEIERLRSALEPFAIHANHYDHRLPGSTIGGSVSNGLPASRLTVAHLRAARAAQMDGATNG